MFIPKAQFEKKINTNTQFVCQLKWKCPPNIGLNQCWAIYLFKITNNETCFFLMNYIYPRVLVN